MTLILGVMYILGFCLKHYYKLCILGHSRQIHGGAGAVSYVRPDCPDDRGGASGPRIGSEMAVLRNVLRGAGFRSPMGYHRCGEVLRYAVPVGENLVLTSGSYPQSTDTPSLA